jgi:hypothetical protein
MLFVAAMETLSAMVTKVAGEGVIWELGFHLTFIEDLGVCRRCCHFPQTGVWGALGGETYAETLWRDLGHASKL